MARINQIAYVSILAAVIGTLPAVVSAHEPAAGAGEGERRSQRAEPLIDPLTQALLIGLAASVLREAAESPDPMATLGRSIERKLMFALRSPELARALDGIIAEAVKDAPHELREPLAQFAIAMLDSFRREMLERRRSDRPYY